MHATWRSVPPRATVLVSGCVPFTTVSALQYQGRDKDCIILSLAGGGAGGAVLLHDWRRVNVAITRAKCKLVFVGNSAHLRSHHLFAQLLDALRVRSWITAVPALVS